MLRLPVSVGRRVWMLHVIGITTRPADVIFRYFSPDYFPLSIKRIFTCLSKYQCFLSLDTVPTVYNRKPQTISRHVLPLLWNLLNSTSNGSAGVNNSALRTSVNRLTTTLYSSMGRALTEHASSQAPRIQEKVHEIIGS